MNKKYYSLHEIEKYLKISPDEIIHLGSRGEMKIYALIPGVKAIERLWDSDPDEDLENAGEYTPQHMDDDYPWVGELYGEYLLSEKDLKRIEAGDEKPLLVLRKNYSDRAVFTYELQDQIPINKFKLVVMAEDIEKLRLHINQNTDKKITAYQSKSDAKNSNTIKLGFKKNNYPEINTVWQTEMEKVASSDEVKVKTKQNIAKIVAKRFGIKVETILRRTRKTW